MNDHLRKLYEQDLPAIAVRMADWTLKFVKVHDVNQWGAPGVDSTRMLRRVEWRDGKPFYCYSPANADGSPRHQATIEFFDLRTRKTAEVSVEDIDVVPRGKHSMDVAEWMNPSPVEFHETVKIAKKVSEESRKAATASASASVEMHSEAEAKAGIKLVEASAKASLTTKLETSFVGELSSVLAKELGQVNGRSFTVPGWSRFRLSLSWEQAAATERVRYSGELQASVRINGAAMFDVRYDSLEDLRDTFRGLHGNRFKRFSSIYAQSPMSDETAAQFLAAPDVVIDVPRKSERASNMRLVTDYDEIDPETRRVKPRSSG